MLLLCLCSSWNVSPTRRVDCIIRVALGGGFIVVMILKCPPKFNHLIGCLIMPNPSILTQHLTPQKSQSLSHWTRDVYEFNLKDDKNLIWNQLRFMIEIKRHPVLFCLCHMSDLKNATNSNCFLSTYMRLWTNFSCRDEDCIN